MEISYSHVWLKSNGDYNSGVKFYEVYGKNNVLKDLFSKGPTKFNIEKLRNEIQIIANHHPEIYLPPGTASKSKKINRADLPEVLQLEFDKLSGLIKTISHQHSRLDLIQNDHDRHIAAGVILNAVEQRRFIFQQIDYYNEHKTFLVKNKPAIIKAPVQLSDDLKIRELQLKQELVLLRSQRSRLKNKPTRVIDYNNILQRISEIENQLNENN